MNVRTVAAAVVVAVSVVMPTPIAAEDFEDIPIIKSTINNALEFERTGATVRWSNPSTGNAGSIVVMRTYYRTDGTPCREYERTTEPNAGAPTRLTGTGCRAGNGVWSLDESAPATTSGDESAPLPPPPSRAERTEEPSQPAPDPDRPWATPPPPDADTSPIDADDPETVDTVEADAASEPTVLRPPLPKPAPEPVVAEGDVPPPAQPTQPVERQPLPALTETEQIALGGRVPAMSQE